MTPAADLKDRIRKAQAILEVGARRFLESNGKLTPQPAAVSARTREVLTRNERGPAGINV